MPDKPMTRKDVDAYINDLHEQLRDMERDEADRRREYEAQRRELWREINSARGQHVAILEAELEVIANAR